MTNISGTTGERPVITTHTSPANIQLGELNPGSAQTVDLVTYTNTGNVPQTVTLSTDNESNIEDAEVYFINSSTEAITIQPSESESARVEFSIRDIENISFGFDVVDEWTL